MKTNELSGAALDWAVAKCEEPELTVLEFKRGWERYNHAASIDWAQAGPIIEREHMAIQPSENDGVWLAIQAWTIYEGPTPLIAAMRCYVASKLGDDVELPDVI